MANTDDSIETLLEQRAQYEQWLAKLDGAGDKAPASVRQKVRGDYEARLRGVIDRLRGHAATIAEELERHRSTQSDLDGQRRQAEEALAEAELRHAVGEYTDEEWRHLNQESDGHLRALRDQLRSVGDEIARLAEVQSLIAAPPRRTEAAAAPTPPRQEMEEPAPQPEPEPEPPAPPPAAKAAPKAREPEPQAASPVDELAFLKSVADQELKPAPASSSRRQSGPGGGAGHAASRTVEAPHAAPAPSGKTGAPGVAKTLKCGECGTLNRPTEWYCERCGAELAGI